MDYIFDTLVEQSPLCRCDLHEVFRDVILIPGLGKDRCVFIMG